MVWNPDEEEERSYRKFPPPPIQHFVQSKELEDLNKDLLKTNQSYVICMCVKNERRRRSVMLYPGVDPNFLVGKCVKCKRVHSKYVGNSKGVVS